MNMIQVIERECGYHGMSDDAVADEHEAQKRLAAAIAEMRAALVNAASRSSVMSIDRTGFDDYLHDASLSDFKHWDEMIEQARRG